MVTTSSLTLSYLNVMMFSIISGALMVGRAASKWSAITMGTEPHACIEIENHATLFPRSTGQAAWMVGHMCPMLMKNDDIAQHGGHACTPANRSRTKACSLGLGSNSAGHKNFAFIYCRLLSVSIYILCLLTVSIYLLLFVCG